MRCRGRQHNRPRSYGRRRRLFRTKNLFDTKDELLSTPEEMISDAIDGETGKNALEEEYASGLEEYHDVYDEQNDDSEEVVYELGSGVSPGHETATIPV